MCLKYITEAKPHTSTVQESFVNAGMDMIIRFGMGSGNFKHHIQHAHATFVACLMLAFREVKAENPDARLLCFHRLYGNRLGLIFGAEPIKLVIQHLKIRRRRSSTW